ncbi:hypothetical protein [Micromonospora chersina]|uniref:hypothetical protein n=1 Tax=Micromonospora chersina TaxID=47854 RepID=UPI003D8B592D
MTAAAQAASEWRTTAAEYGGSTVASSSSHRLIWICRPPNRPTSWWASPCRTVSASDRPSR